VDKIVETIDNIKNKILFVGCTEGTLIVSFVILLTVCAVYWQCQSITDCV